MSYSISISGHGAKKADVEQAFSDAVRTLRKSDPSGTVSGSASGSDPEEGQINISASDVDANVEDKG